MLKKYVFYVIVIGALLSGLVYWITWSGGKIKEVTELEGRITSLEKDKADLQTAIDTATADKKDTDIVFDKITDDQVTLLCAARYSQPLPPEKPGTPTIVEVVKWRDAATKCPTTDPTKAEVVTNGAVMRPVNDEIRVRSLNNSWKAYCAAIDNKEDVCTPFR